MNWKKTWILTLTLLLTSGLACQQRISTEDLVVLNVQSRPLLDPRVGRDPAAERVRHLVFNSLTRLDENNAPIPDLAEQFSASADFKTFTFRLRRGVRFHNDRLLSSLDVKYTFETLLAPSFSSEKKDELIRFLSTIEVPDPSTIVFHCHSSFPDLPVAVHSIGIIPEGTTTQQSDRPIGTGPYRFISQVEGQEILLAPYLDYFNTPPGDSPKKSEPRTRLRLRLIRAGKH